MVIDLKGWSVLVTRPEPASARLAERVLAANGFAIVQPGLRIESTDDPGARQQLQRLEHYDAVILTSPNALRVAMQLRPRTTWPGHLLIMAVGHATGQEARDAGFEDVLAPPPAASGSEALLAAALTIETMPKRILMLAAPGGRTWLVDEFKRHGARVDLCHLYHRVSADRAPGNAQKLAAAGDRLIVIATSEFILESVTAMFDALNRQPVVVPSERVGARARALGYERVAVAERPDDAAMVAAAAQFVDS